MTFPERVAAQPVEALVACLVWIPVTVWVLGLVAWTVSGDLDWELGVPSAVAAVLLGILTVDPPVPGMAPFLFLAVVSLVALFPFVRAGVRRRQLVAMDVERIEAAYGRLGDRPNDLPAIVRLAETVYQRGMLGPAIGLMERVEPQMNLAYFGRELAMLGAWRAAVRRPTDVRPLDCLACGSAVETSRTHCPKCGRPYLLDYARGRWFRGLTDARLLTAWLAGLLVVVGIPVTAQAGLGQGATVALIAVQVAVGTAVILRALVRLGRGGSG